MKKLTAGIFTVMLGLCATSGADAAVASKGYVDSFVGEQGSITSTISSLTQTVADNKTTAANATKAVADDLADYKTTNAAALELKANSADVYTKTQADAEFMNSTEVNNAITNAVTGENGALKDYAKVTELNATNQNVTANTNAISAINDAETGILAVAKKYADDNDADTIYDDTTVKADIAKNAGAIATLNGNDQTEGSVAYQVKELADGAVATNTTAIATLNGDAQTAGSVAYQVKALADGAVATNTAAIATLNGDANTAGSVAKSIADEFAKANLSQYETVEGALAKYEQKTKLKALAYKDTVGTDDIDDLAVTTDKLADGAVESGKIANGAVTDEKISAVASSKVTGLSESLAEKLTIPTAANETDGKYVLTATSANGQATYYWELIAREGEQ